MSRIVKVEPRDKYCLFLCFEDGTEGVVDLSHLVSKGVFQIWEKPGCFDRVEIGPDGDLIWDDQVDMCPDALYLKLTGKSFQQAFQPDLEASTDAGH